MEPNFIEEVSKALDTLGVERLVRTLPMGSVRCIPCGDKVVYTWVQARYMTIKNVRSSPPTYLDIYRCKEFGGENYHLTNLDKKFSTRNYWIQEEIRAKKSDLDRFRVWKNDLSPDRQGLAGEQQQNLVVVDGRYGSAFPYTKALRRKVLRALVVPVQGLRKPRTHRFRRSFKPRRRISRRDTARRDFPRGEIMTKMLSWANSHKFHVDNEHRSCRPRGDGAEFRRRNRAREAEAVRRDLEQELGALEPLQGPEEWHQNRGSTNMAALDTVDFDGCYTSPIEKE